MTQAIYNRIGKNIIYNLLSKFFGFPLWLALPPIILGYIGVEGYGVWVVIQAFVNYGGILNTGVDATVKYTAEYKAKGNYSKITEIFNTFFILNSILFFIFCIVVFVCQNWLIDVFIKTNKIPRGDISCVLILYAVTFAIKNIYRGYSSFLTGLEKMDITNKVEMLSFVCNFISSIAFLHLRWGIKGLAIASVLSSVITFFIYIWICAKETPYLKLNPFLFSFGVLSEAYKFISYGVIGGIAGTSMFYASKLICSRFLEIKYITYYDLGQRLVVVVFGIFGSVLTPIMPAASSVHTNMGAEKLKEVFQTTFKHLALISIPVFLFMAVFAGWIISVWVGPECEKAVSVLRFLSIAYLIVLLTGPGALILTGMGLIEIPFYGTILTAAMNVILSLVLVTRFGLNGIIISDLISYTIGAIFGLYFLQKKLGSSITNILRGIKFPFFASMGILIILSLISIMSFTRNSRNYYIELPFAAILFAISYILLVYNNPQYARVRDFIRRPLYLFTYRD